MKAVTDYGPASIENLINGTAPAPFQYRVLLPWIVGLLKGAEVLSPAVEEAKGYCYGIEILSTSILFVVMWFYLGLFFRSVKIRAVGMLLLVYALSMTYLVPRGLIFYYVYDVPSVCLFTMGLYFLRLRKIPYFYILFVISTINRETSCFLAMALLFTQWREGRGWSVLHSVVLAILWVGIKYAIASMYELNSMFTWTFYSNLRVLAHPYALFQVLSSIGLLWLVVGIGWQYLHISFLREVAVIAPIFFAAMFSVANVHEIRVYGELIPVLLPAALVVFAGLFSENADSL